MSNKRLASESALSEKAIAFSVDALLGHPQSKLRKTDSSSSYLKSGKSDSKDKEYDSNKGSSEFREDYLISTKETKEIDSVQAASVKSTSIPKDEIVVQLEGKELWAQFHRLGNEMIITKCGRRIFPSLKVKVSGLDPDSYYILWVDIVPVDNVRYRYVYHSSQWMIAGAGETPYPLSAYVHPESPCTGRQWISQAVVFDKLKLTNCKIPLTKGQISLHSMHKYQPRVHIQKTMSPNCDPKQQIDLAHSLTFVFPETQFITVTAYQNQQITRLKIASNPFAKGFREIMKPNRKSSDNSSSSAFTSTVSNVLTNSGPSCFTHRNVLGVFGSSISMSPALFPLRMHPSIYTGRTVMDPSAVSNMMKIDTRSLICTACQNYSNSIPSCCRSRITTDKSNASSVPSSTVPWTRNSALKEESVKPTARVAPCVITATPPLFLNSSNSVYGSSWFPNRIS